MLPRSFYFLRHGETDWNRQQFIQGHTDIPLNDLGRTQARLAAEVIRKLPVDVIISSPLSRALETADIVNADLQKPVVTDAGIRERHYGVFEGVHFSKMETMRQKMLEEGAVPEENGYPCPPEGESYTDFSARTIGAMTRHLHGHEEQNILFVAHGGVYRVLQRALLQELGHSPNARPYHFEKQENFWRLVDLAEA